MKEKKQNEELQSRREFFKNAAKKALPVIGAIALVSSPIIAKAAETEPMGCQFGCSDGCYTSCDGSCRGGCMGCSGTCTGGCNGSCMGGCYQSCRGYY